MQAISLGPTWALLSLPTAMVWGTESGYKRMHGLSEVKALFSHPVELRELEACNNALNASVYCVIIIV